MGRFTGQKRRFIYRLGEMFSPREADDKQANKTLRRSSRRPGRLQLFLLLLLSAAIFVLAGKKLYQIHLAQTEPLAKLEVYQNKLDHAKSLNEQLQRENESLQHSFNKTRDAMLVNFNYSSPENRALLEAYQAALVMAGMTDYKGPGIRIVMQDKEDRSEDSKQAITQIVHDADLRYIVDLLKQNYVSALAVNDERLAPMSPLICTGPSVLVNRVYKASPFVIDAGSRDPAAIMAAVQNSAGYKQFEKRGLKITFELFDELEIAAQKDMTYVNAQIDKLEAKK